MWLSETRSNRLSILSTSQNRQDQENVAGRLPLIFMARRESNSLCQQLGEAFVHSCIFSRTFNVFFESYTVLVEIIFF